MKAADDKTSLEIKRVIHASRDCVYTAWTDPAQLKEWWGPEGVETIDFVNDVRVDGKYRWELRTREGEEMAVFGEYRELVPGKKIVFTWKWDDDETWEARNSIVTVEFSDCEGGTEVRLLHRLLPSEESRNRHNQGWNSVLDRLEQFINK